MGVRYACMYDTCMPYVHMHDMTHPNDGNRQLSADETTLLSGRLEMEGMRHNFNCRSTNDWISVTALTWQAIKTIGAKALGRARLRYMFFLLRTCILLCHTCIYIYVMYVFSWHVVCDPNSMRSAIMSRKTHGDFFGHVVCIHV